LCHRTTAASTASNFAREQHAGPLPELVVETDHLPRTPVRSSARRPSPSPHPSDDAACAGHAALATLIRSTMLSFRSTPPTPASKTGSRGGLTAGRAANGRRLCRAAPLGHLLFGDHTDWPRRRRLLRPSPRGGALRLRPLLR
jgi:hypothetical protein